MHKHTPLNAHVYVSPCWCVVAARLVLDRNNEKLCYELLVETHQLPFFRICMTSITWPIAGDSATGARVLNVLWANATSWYAPTPPQAGNSARRWQALQRGVSRSSSSLTSLGRNLSSLEARVGTTPARCSAHPLRYEGHPAANTCTNRPYLENMRDTLLLTHAQTDPTWKT